MKNSFIDQVASHEILKCVTNLCSECYDELKVGDTIYYDLREYRYLCQECHRKLCDAMSVDCEIIDDDEVESLFG